MYGQEGFPLIIVAGQTYTPLPILWNDVNGNPVNLTGYNAVFTGRQTINSPDPVPISATSGAGQIILGGVAGTIQYNFSSVLTASWPFPWCGRYDLWLNLGAIWLPKLWGELKIIQPAGGPARP